MSTPMFPAEMPSAELSPAEMRQAVLRVFQHRLERVIPTTEFKERVRIEEGRLVAYSYRADDLFAMWMVPIGLVQFYDERGNMFQTFDLTAPAHPERRAA